MIGSRFPAQHTSIPASRPSIPTPSLLSAPMRGIVSSSLYLHVLSHHAIADNQWRQARRAGKEAGRVSRPLRFLAVGLVVLAGLVALALYVTYRQHLAQVAAQARATSTARAARAQAATGTALARAGQATATAGAVATEEAYA